MPVLVLHEAEYFRRPHASPFARLIRPLTHPSVAARLGARFTTFVPAALDGYRAVIVDRLGPPEMHRPEAAALAAAARAAGARLVYSLDDNLLDLRAERGDWPTQEKLDFCEFLLAEADRVVVSTPQLASDLASRRPDAICIRNDLDERLLVDGQVSAYGRPDPFFADQSDRPLVIGYMGTLTHDQDFALVRPALAEMVRRFGRRVRVQCVGVFRHGARLPVDDLPIRFLKPFADEDDYPLFMLWWSTQVRWDIGLAPLRDTPFTRGKSDLKHLDYAAIGAAGVFSRVPAYIGTVRDGETGLVVDNTPGAWVEAISRLVEDAELRARLAAGAHRYLWRERVLARGGAMRWVEVLEGHHADRAASTSDLPDV